MAVTRYNAPRTYENVKRGEYLIGERKLFFRSKMEANFALYLDFLKRMGEIIDWQYEPKTFVFEKILFGTRSYKPDFAVTEKTGKIIYYECKGYMDKKSRTKLKRMRIYYPDVKIVLIDTTFYRSLHKWSKLLKFF